jgi:hypothetical protein
LDPIGIVAIIFKVATLVIMTDVRVKPNAMLSVILKAKSTMLVDKLMVDFAYVEVFITDNIGEFSEITYTADLLLFVIRFMGLDIPVIVFNSF